MELFILGFWKGVISMSKITGVIPHENYTLSLSFDDGSELTFNMQKQVDTIRFHKLKGNGLFEKARFDDKSVYWAEDGSPPSEIAPLRLTLDNILFSLRDAR